VPPAEPRPERRGGAGAGEDREFVGAEGDGAAAAAPSAASARVLRAVRPSPSSACATTAITTGFTP
jgi:hypothetical protein